MRRLLSGRSTQRLGILTGLPARERELADSPSYETFHSLDHRPQSGGESNKKSAASRPRQRFEMLVELIGIEPTTS
ncbi:MAG TPA: hypothetical protein VM557_04950 [Thermoanaerobaculia bacterium]|nr:hypothetical protein [Thermoanaerobaculia bacterium]